jgi:O-antigen/teichoic acid export membrane protein
LPGWSLAGRLGWSMTDQALFSVTNAALSIIVARGVTAEAFGAFAISFSVYAFLIGLQRAWITEPFTMRFADAQPAVLRAAARHATGAALWLGCCSGLLVMAVGLGLRGTPTGTSLLALAVSLPGLLVQDSFRAVFFSQGRARSAAANDGLGAVVQLAGAGTLVATGHASVLLLVLTWGTANTLGALYGCLQSRFLPQPGGALRWMSGSRHLWGFMVPQYLGVMGCYQFAVLLVGVVGTAGDVGALRSAAVLLGPLSILSSSILAFAIPEIVRRRDRPPSFHLRAALVISGAHVLATAAWGGLLLALPYEAGQAVLGDSWTTGRSILPAAVVGQAAVLVTVGVSTVLIGFSAAKALLRLSFLLPPLHISLGVGGSLLFGVQGAAAGFALSACITAPFWWIYFNRFLRRMSADRAAGALGTPRGIVTST